MIYLIQQASFNEHLPPKLIALFVLSRDGIEGIDVRGDLWSCQTGTENNEFKLELS